MAHLRILIIGLVLGTTTLAWSVTAQTSVTSMQTKLATMQADAQVILDRNAALKPKARMPVWVTDAAARVVTTAKAALAETQLIVVSGPPKPPPPPAAGGTVPSGLLDLSLMSSYYVGGFRVPNSYGSFTYPCYKSQAGFGGGVSGQALYYKSDTNTLLMSSQENCVAEFDIPSSFRIVSSQADIANAPRASLVIQSGASIGDFYDPTDDSWADMIAYLGGYHRVEGLLVYGGRLLFTATGIYGGATPPWTHKARSTNLYSSGSVSAGSFVSWGGLTNRGRWVAAYMGHIPTEFQSSLGGTVFTGQCCDSIVGEQSDGPSFIVFNPDDVGVDATMDTSTLLMGYGGGYNNAIGSYHTVNGIWSAQGEIRGAAIIKGTYTLLMVGRNGFATPGYTVGAWGGPSYPGGYCYGVAQNTNPANHNVTTGPVYCYNPQSNDLGGQPSQHVWPVRSQMWGFDLRDLIHVKNGDINPATGVAWNPGDIIPYQYPIFTVPTESAAILNGTGYAVWGGMAYDRVNNRVFVVQRGADDHAVSGGGLENAPFIHVWQLPNP